MKTTFAIFGALTALNSLTMVVWVYFAFDMDRTEWLSHSRDFYLNINNATYVFLVVALTIDTLIWAYTKWKTSHG